MLRTLVFKWENRKDRLDQALQTIAQAIRLTVSTAAYFCPDKLAANHAISISTAITVALKLIKTKKTNYPV